MSARQAIQVGTKTVRPVLSLNSSDAKRRVRSLYKAWYRQIPYLVKDYDIPKSEDQCRTKLRELFMKNAGVADIRVIDILVIKQNFDVMEIEVRKALSMIKDAGKSNILGLAHMGFFVKGQMELEESVRIWKQKGHIMSYFKPTEEPKPKDFLSKFFSGIE